MKGQHKDPWLTSWILHNFLNILSIKKVIKKGVMTLPQRDLDDNRKSC